LGKGQVHTGFWWGNLRENEHLEGLWVVGRIILKKIMKKWCGDTDCIDVTQDRNRWRAVVNAVMNLRVT